MKQKIFKTIVASFILSIILFNAPFPASNSGSDMPDPIPTYTPAPTTPPSGGDDIAPLSDLDGRLDT